MSATRRNFFSVSRFGLLLVFLRPVLALQLPNLALYLSILFNHALLHYVLALKSIYWGVRALAGNTEMYRLLLTKMLSGHANSKSISATSRKYINSCSLCTSEGLIFT